MEKHLNVLNQALNKANQSGAFTLNESAIIAQALSAVAQALQPNPIEKARAEAKENRQNKSLTPVQDTDGDEKVAVKGDE